MQISIGTAAAFRIRTAAENSCVVWNISDEVSLSCMLLVSFHDSCHPYRLKMGLKSNSYAATQRPSPSSCA